MEQIDRLLREDERMQSAGAACDAAKVRLEKARNALRSIEHLTTEQQVKIEQTNATLYSGMVKNPKELQDLQKEIISLRKHLGTLEDQQLEAMIEFEEAEQAEQAAQAFQKKVEAEVIQAKAGLAGERSQLIAKLENLGQERNAALPPITADNLEIYNQIRNQKHGIAVTSVEDDACYVMWRTDPGFGGPIGQDPIQTAVLQLLRTDFIRRLITNAAPPTDRSTFILARVSRRNAFLVPAWPAATAAPSHSRTLSPDHSLHPRKESPGSE